MIIILIGVSGAGKTTVGRLLAQDLGWPFYEGDDFHPQSNVAKMAQGVALTDEDRWPWLDRIRELIGTLVDSHENAVIACSALKHTYRKHLLEGYQGMVLVYLKGNYSLIRSRLAQRQNHFMKADLLDSQFRTLEEPEGAITIEVVPDPQEIVDAVKQALVLA